MTTSRDRKFLNKAEEVSKLSDHYRHKIGAVIVKGRKVVSTGFNTISKSHPLQAYYASCVGREEAIYLHAEMAAIVASKACSKELKGCIIYVFRRGLDGKVRMSRPCRSCLKALKDFGIRCIVYSTDEGVAKEYLEGN